MERLPEDITPLELATLAARFPDKPPEEAVKLAANLLIESATVIRAEREQAEQERPDRGNVQGRATPEDPITKVDRGIIQEKLEVALANAINAPMLQVPWKVYSSRTKTVFPLSRRQVTQFVFNSQTSATMDSIATDCKKRCGRLFGDKGGPDEKWIGESEFNTLCRDWKKLSVAWEALEKKGKKNPPAEI